MVKTPKPTWFSLGSGEDAATINKAFLLAGIISGDASLAAATDLSALHSGLQRRMAPGRVGALQWLYPSEDAEHGIEAKASDLASIYDSITARRDPLNYAEALRLEVPVTLDAQPEIGGVEGLTPDDIYSALGIGLDTGTEMPVSMTFTMPQPRSGFSFDWPLRVASNRHGVKRGWAATEGYVGIVRPGDAYRFDATGEIDLYLDVKPPHDRAKPLNSVFAITDKDIADFSIYDWQRLVAAGAVVVPNVGSRKLTPWLNELTRAIARDRPFDVAVFEAWYESGERTPAPVLFAWEGAFDRARLSNLVAPTIRSLRSFPSTYKITMPIAVAREFGVPTSVSARRLASTLESAAPLQFDKDGHAGHVLKIIRSQLEGPAPLAPPSRRSAERIVFSDPLPGADPFDFGPGFRVTPKKVARRAKGDAGGREGPAKEEPAAEAQLESAVAATESPARFVNAWLEDGEPPLLEGRTYTLAINIGKLREDAVGSAPLAKIDWGDRTELNLLCVVSGSGASVTPGRHAFKLTPDGDVPAMRFALTPTRPGMIGLRIGLYLARELTLLEEFEARIAVKAQAKVA